MERSNYPLQQKNLPSRNPAGVPSPSWGGLGRGVSRKAHSQATTKRKWIPAFAGMTAVFILVLSSAAHATTLTDRIHTTTPPQKIPPFVYTDANNAQHALSDFRGSYILLNIWATWCAPCTHEMPSLDALQKQFGDKKLHIVTLSEDRGDAIVTGFYKTHNIANLPVAIDTAGTAPSAFHLNGLPTTLLIDPQGNEIARLEGEADWSSPEAVDFLHSKIP